jgi:hypothetical protein
LWFIIVVMFEIETGVEIAPKNTPERKTKYPFASMQKGDSFVCHLDGEEWRVVENRVRSAAANWGSRRGVKFVTRKVPQGIRVWRVK